MSSARRWLATMRLLLIVAWAHEVVRKLHNRGTAYIMHISLLVCNVLFEKWSRLRGSEFHRKEGDHKTKTPYINLSRKLKCKRVKSHNMNIFKILTKNHYKLFHYGFRQNLFCFPFTLTAVLPIDQLWTTSKALLK